MISNSSIRLGRLQILKKGIIYAKVRIKLHLAILKIQECYTFDEILFWGRLEGLEKDYYIAMGIQYRGEFEFPKKKFFWASNTFVFAELPAYNEEFASRAANLRTPLSGQHEKIVFRGDISLEDSLMVQLPPQGKHFSELERVSFIVDTVETECAIVPVGAYRLTPTHELMKNTQFSVEPKLENYYRYWNSIIALPQTSFSGEDRYDWQFGDNIQLVMKLYSTQGSWIRLQMITLLDSGRFSRIQQSEMQLLIMKQTTVRSLTWPGFVAFNDAFTFGYAYFGDGVRNSDFEFMI